jgi:hypothetical protein
MDPDSPSMGYQPVQISEFDRALKLWLAAHLAKGGCQRVHDPLRALF